MWRNDDFERLVEYMREMQRVYFASRTASNLLRAKNAEARVDEYLARLRMMELPLWGEKQNEGKK